MNPKIFFAGCNEVHFQSTMKMEESDSHEEVNAEARKPLEDVSNTTAEENHGKDAQVLDKDEHTCNECQEVFPSRRKMVSHYRQGNMWQKS